MKTAELSTTAEAVLAEVKEVYFDCWNNLPWATMEKRRRLNFLASHSVTRDEAVEIMAQAVPNGYNEFQPNGQTLAKFPDDSQITLAREGSVCVYVQGKLPANKKYQNDEHTYYPPIPGTPRGETRLWWD